MTNTRFKDKYNNPIYEGDYIHVHDGLYDFEGIVESVYDGWRDKYSWHVVYYDIGEYDPIPLCRFAKENREILNGKDEHEKNVRLIKAVMNR
jgi:hypothetical protein